MSTLSPALADAGHLLREDLYDHLHEAEYLAEQDDEWSTDDGETARKLIGDPERRRLGPSRRVMGLVGVVRVGSFLRP